jgi:tRNA threonylcarbamoyladenosine biosynthesis protein TsaB
MTRLLAFDTSTEAMAIALALQDGIRAVDAAGGTLASARLVPEIMGLLADAGCTLQQLDAIAFGRGPGAFTGLRTACSVAQGLALGAGKPVLAIDSLMLVAEQARPDAPDGDDVWVAMDARMNEVYAAHYRRQGGRWQAVASPALHTLEALNAQWHEAAPARIAGNASAVFGEKLHVARADLLPPTGSRAAALGRLATAAWLDGEGVDAALALPVYLRDKVAQTTEERDAARALKTAQTAPTP